MKINIKFPWYVLAVVITALVNLLYISVFSRILSSENLGIYFVLIQVVSVGSMIFYGWYIYGVLRYEPSASEGGIKDLSIGHSTIVIFGGIITILFIIIFLSLNFIIEINNIENIVILSICIFSEGIFRLVTTIFQSRRYSKYYSIAISTLAIGRYGFAYFIYQLGLNNYYCLLVGYIIAEIIINVLSLNILKIRIDISFAKLIINCKESLKIYRKYFIYSYPLIALALITEVKPLIDRLLVSYFIGIADVAIYVSNLSIGIGMLGMVSQPILLTTHSILMRVGDNYGGGKFKYCNYKIMELYIVLTSAILLFIAPNSKSISELFLSSELNEGHLYILIGFISAQIGGLSIYLGKPFELYNKTKTMFSIHVLSYFAYLLLSILMIKTYSIMGLAISGIVLPLSTLILQLVILKWRKILIFPWLPIILSYFYVGTIYLIISLILNKYMVLLLSILSIIIYYFIIKKKIFSYLNIIRKIK